MKKNFALLFLCSSLSLSAYDNYLKTSILYTAPSNLKSSDLSYEMKNGYALELAVGEKMSRNLSFDIQYTYDNADLKEYTANIKVHSLYLNGIYDINLSNRYVHPYLGIGAGGAVYSDGNYDDTIFTYQGFAGVSFETDYNIETFIEYKYKAFDQVVLDGVTFDNSYINSIGFGIKSKF